MTSPSSLSKDDWLMAAALVTPKGSDYTPTTFELIDAAFAASGLTPSAFMKAVSKRRTELKAAAGCTPPRPKTFE